MKLHVTLAIALTLISTPAFGDDGGRKLSTSLNGPEEVPGPGDPNGTGSFEGRFNPGQEEVCYTLKAFNIARPTVAHIHRGVKGRAGPPVIDLVAPPVDGASETCKTAPRELIKEIIQTPSDFYVNVHNAEFRPGAVRGQLSK